MSQGGTAAVGAKAKLEVRLATEQDLEALAAFYREVWDPAATAASVAEAWKQTAAEGSPAPVMIALLDGRVVGHCGTIPFSLWQEQTLRPVHWLKGLMVVPEMRNGPVGFMVVKQLTAAVADCGALVVAAPAVRLFTALGYRDLGILSDRLRPLKPTRILKQLDPALLGERGQRYRGLLRALRLPGLADLAGLGTSIGLAGLRFGASRGVPSRSELRIDTGAVSTSELDELWSRVRGALPIGPARNAAALERRYELAAGGGSIGYRAVAVRARSGGRLEGIAVVRPPRTDGGDARLRGIKIATLADALYDPDRPAVGAALADGAAQLAKTLGADAVLGAGSDPRWLQVLRARGYLPVPSRIHVVWRRRPDSPEVPPLERWWLGRGDSDADATF